MPGIPGVDQCLSFPLILLRYSFTISVACKTGAATSQVAVFAWGVQVFPAFRRRFADAEKSHDGLSVKGAQHRRRRLALDGRSVMDRASLSEWRSKVLGKNPLPFVVRSEALTSICVLQ